MCEARRAIVGVLALALMVSPAAHAQAARTQDARVDEPGAQVERLRLRADSLEIAVAAAEAQIETLRAPARAEAAVALDTQRVGPVTVVSERRHGAQARETVRRALAELGDVSAVAGRALDSTYLVLGIGGSADDFDIEEGAGGQVVRLTLPRWMPRSVQVRRVARSIGIAIARALPDDLHAWSGSAGVPLGSESVYREAYRSLSLSTSTAAHACLAGDIERCMDALSLTDPGATWQTWYDEAGLVRWAVSEARRGLREGRRGSAQRQVARACEDARTYAACRPLIEQRGGPPQPLQPIARASLLLYVLEEGGAAAWAVLATDTAGPLRDRLAAAAGIDASGLVEAWRARVLAERPSGFADLGSSTTATLLWVAVLAALASRSTRWRLG